MPGTLFVVATPIGNLEDLSFRALRTLREVDVIAAEDTRRTSKLLAHYDVRRPLVSLREHNETREAPRLVARLVAGQSIALVSDAGTPGIADPGTRLVRTAREAAVRVVPIPGPSAITAALSASGFPANQFVFLGFPPVSGAARERWLDGLAKDGRTAVFFEAPHRIARTLQDCHGILVNRQIIAFRELTKVHEELVIYQNSPVKELGEFCVVIEPSSDRQSDPAVTPEKAASMAAMFGYLTNNAALSRQVAISMTARAFELDDRLVAKTIKQYRYSVKRQNLPS